MDYSDGSLVSEDNLDLSNKQAIMVAAEAVDAAGLVTARLDDIGNEFVGDPGPSGPMGPAGGHAGDFATAGTREVPDSISIVLTNDGRHFIYDAAVDATFVAANPLISFRSSNGRGFREVRKGVKLKPYLLLIAGQSNAVGANNGGPNPASPGVKAWNGSTSAWGSSDYTLAPWISGSPTGNGGNNNMALAAAHRIYEETGRPVFIVWYFEGGTSIDQWVPNGPFDASLHTRMTAALATPELALAGVTEADALIWAQGEEDYTGSFATHLANLALLEDQFRARAWFGEATPIYMTGPSDLHDRYQIERALRWHCSKVSNRCIFVPSNGLKTEFGETGAGDFTHFLGESLWEMGYHRIASNVLTGGINLENDPALFYGRGDGSASPASPTAIASFDHLVNWSSRDTASTSVNSHAATGSIAWGQACVSDGNYTFALGYEVTTSNGCNYSLAAGREVALADGADYSVAGGFQNASSAPYSFMAGRGHTLVTAGEAALGLFTKYTDGSRLFQFGVGSSSAARKNAIAVAPEGNVEVYAPSAGADPVDNEQYTFRLIDTDTIRLLAKGSDGTVRHVDIELATAPIGTVQPSTGSASSGTYAPTATAVSNCDAAPVVAKAVWTRIGNIVTVTGYVNVDATVASADTQFKLPLPIASALAVAGDLTGHLTAWSSSALSGGAITAAPVDDMALCRIYASSTSARDYTFSFAYEVL